MKKISALFARRKTYSIRSRIIFITSASTLIVLSIFWAVFNIALFQYIKSSAISQLNRTTDIVSKAMEKNTDGDDGNIKSFVAEISDYMGMIPRSSFRIQLSMFELYDDFEIMDFRVLPDPQNEILEYLRSSHINLEKIGNLNIRTKNGNYYITSYTMPKQEGLKNGYLIFYVDVTGLSNFAAGINIFFIYLVLSIWLLSISFTALLSSTIVKPIRRIREFAYRIGKGDFSQNNISFLDTEINELNRIMNQTAKQLEIYDKDQKTFFQNASHELRTPLMSIKCYAEGIEYGVMEPVKASKTILEETDRLTGMVEDLLYLSRIDNITPSYTAEASDIVILPDEKSVNNPFGRKQYGEKGLEQNIERNNNCDLREIVRVCAGSQKSLAENRHISIGFDFDNAPVLLKCNERLMSRAVSNLISNAIRYAHKEIILECKTDGHNAVISCADDGVGVSAEDMPHIFERFYKGTGGNHGIGLSIVKSISEAHNGSVEAVNCEKGAVFTIRLPL